MIKYTKYVFGEDMINAITTLLGVSKNSYWNYKKQDRPIIAFLEKYFSKEEIEEFLETGSMQKLENQNALLSRIDLHEKLLADHALYSSKEKLQKLLDGNFIDRAIYTKGAKGILVDVLERIDSNDASYTMENAKQRLMDAVANSEVSWFSLKNPQKQKLLSSILNKHLSDIEAYAIIKNPKEVLNY